MLLAPAMGSRRAIAAKQRRRYRICSAQTAQAARPARVERAFGTASEGWSTGLCCDDEARSQPGNPETKAHRHSSSRESQGAGANPRPLAESYLRFLRAAAIPTGARPRARAEREEGSGTRLTVTSSTQK